MEKNTKEYSREALHARIWAIADELRGNMDANEFKNYILGFIFYKHLSEKLELHMNEELKEDGLTFTEAWEEEDYKEDLMDEGISYLGYFIEPKYLFSNIIEKAKVNTPASFIPLTLVTIIIKKRDVNELSKESDSKMNSFGDFKAYYDYVRERCIPCTDNSIKVRKVSKVARTTVQQQPLIAHGICRASFLNNKGKVPQKSGLNWGCSGAHVSKGDAYIRITMDYVRTFPKMFPPKKYVDGIENINSTGRKNRENDEVELIWDDGTVMIGLLEGQNYNKIDGMVYPKQLSSAPQKSVLGTYLRKRIGVSLDHVITMADLKRYGRYDVDISLIGEGIYYMDFSVNK